MYWEKKICFRITTRRIVGAILAASTVMNLVIVGAVFGADSPSAAPTLDSVLTNAPSTSTVLVLASTTGEMSTFISTQTSEAPPLETFTPTPTSIDSPIWVVCIKRFYWPTYRVQQGDRLSSIASITGQSVTELMAANCLTNDQIYAGQLLYVPRLPRGPITLPATNTATAILSDTPTETVTVTYTATDTPTNTPTSTLTVTSTDTSTGTYTPTDTATSTPTTTLTETPTITLTLTDSPAWFQNTVGMLCDPPGYVSFEVMAYDPQDIILVTVLLYTKSGKLIEQILMEKYGDIYTSSGTLPPQYSVFDIDYYQFSAMDSLKNITFSQAFRNRSNLCVAQTTLTPGIP